MPTTTQPDTALRTELWRLIGLTRSEPALLELADGRLALTTGDGRQFDVPLAEVERVVFPWYYFGGGCKLTVGGKEHRISFVRPNDASDLPARLLAHTDVGAPFALLTVGRKVTDIGSGRRAGKAWKAALAGVGR